MDKEEWCKIIDYDGYEISNYGNVKSYKNSRWGNKLSFKLLKPRKDTKGYYFVSLNNKNFPIHILVSIFFLNHKPDKSHNIVVDHIDNNKENNYYKNLQLITNRENCSKDKITFTNLTGVTYDKRKNKFQSRIRIGSNRIHLGLFETKEEAYLMYLKAVSNINKYTGNNSNFRSILNE